MVIEDDPGIAMALQLGLEMEGHEVTVEGNGAVGLSRLQAGASPDVLLVDLVLPGLGGREILEAVAADPLLRTVPVIVITAAAKADQLPRRGTYHTLLRKPFELDEIAGAISAALAGAEPER